MSRRKYGSGGVTKKGYIRINKTFEHRRIWRKYHGPVPQGFFIHHKNEDKTDNRIENLELVDALTHKRIHSGCRKLDGNWFKPCCRCGIEKAVSTSYYKRKDGISPWCKQCCFENAVDNKRRRKLERKKFDPSNSQTSQAHGIPHQASHAAKRRNIARSIRGIRYNHLSSSQTRNICDRNREGARVCGDSAGTPQSRN